jgi:hypothetical protein
MSIHLQLPILIIGLLAIPRLMAYGAEERGNPLTPQLRQMIEWLPDDTETLVVLNGPTESMIVQRGEETPQQFLGSLPCRLVHSLRHGLLKAELKGEKLLHAVEGSRRFRSPKDIGVMPYEGCQIMRFSDLAQAALQRAFNLCLQKANETIHIEGQQIAVFEERWEQDTWTLFVARPEPTLLLCATNRDYLAQVLDRMKRPGKARAFPADLPEWRHVQTNATVWAIRHYSREDGVNDPSSPLQGPATANGSDPKAIGFVFWWGATSPKTATARYLTRAKKGVTIVTEGWNHPNESFTPAIREVEPGVVEIRATVTDETAGMLVLVLMGYLGHAVYL